MTPEHYQRIGSLFEAALERAPAERAAWLQEACGADVALQAEVEKLLAHHEESDDFLSRPALHIAAAQLAQQQPASLTGQEISHYQVVSLLGAGGMGQVWLARDKQLERQVALKLLPAAFTQDAERVRRFMQEAKAASSLNHPNIVTLHEIGESDVGRFLVMELVAGRTLREAMREDHSLVDLLSIATQIAEALSAAHAAGITHRDIKPDNVMVRDDGYVKVLDFGLARLDPVRSAKLGARNEEAETLLQHTPRSEFCTPHFTQPGVVMGTVAYMSPEQARGEAVDTRTDIFSLGVVLYEMLTHGQPFTGETVNHAIVAILEKEPPPLADYVADVPVELERIVLKALAKDPAARYQTTKELLLDLKGLKRALELEAPPGHLGATASLQRQANTHRLHPPATDENRAPQNTSSAKIIFGEIKRHKVGVALTSAALMALLAGLAIYRYATAPGSQPATRIIPLTSFPGEEQDAAFSPDGKQMAFSWNGGQEDAEAKDIYVKLLDAGEPLRLTNDPAPERSPAWSPDGRHIAFMRYAPATTSFSIHLITALGGAERKLSDGLLAHNPGLRWSPDGEFLALSLRNAAAEADAVFLLKAKTGEKRQITFPAMGWRGDSHPVFSPDGQTLAFVRWTSTGAADLFVVPRAGGKEKQLTFDKRSMRGITWAANGREIIFASERRGLSRLWRIPSNGGEPEAVAGSGLGVQFPVVSPSGTQLAYQQIHSDTNIWQIDLTNPASRATRLIASTLQDDSPQFAPDGQSILFGSTRSGSYEIWTCKPDGTQLLQLTHLDGPLAGTPRWSPDGQHIAFDLRAEGNADIFLCDASGGALRRLVSGNAEDVLPSWSRDGRWLYFASNRSGKREIWKMPMSGGEPIQVTKAGGFEGFESPDGQWFYFTKRSRDNGLWRIPVAGGEESLVLEPGKNIYRRNWAVAEQGIYFGAYKTTIEFFSFATGKVSLVATTPRDLAGMVPSLAVDATGQRLLCTLIEQEGSDIMLLDNFR
jgi:eukaryotic-like serine/threonine-protein kinase